jgi:hypothetical protein
LPRAFSTALVLVLLGATAVAFSVTEGLKLEPSPIRSVSVDKIVSPTCDCSRDEAAVRFRLRKGDRLTLAMLDSGGVVVRTLVGPRETHAGVVTATWDGRDDAGAVVRDGAYRPRVHLARSHRTIVLPNPIRVDTKSPRVAVVRVTRHVLVPGKKLSVGYRVSEPAQVSLYVDGMRVVRGRSTRTVWKLDWYGLARRVPGGITPGTHRLTLVARDIAGNISIPSGPVRVRIPIFVAPVLAHPRPGTRFAVHLVTDGHPYHWQLAGKGGTARSRRLVVRAPNRPGRYAFVVRQHGDRVAAPVHVRPRR